MRVLKARPRAPRVSVFLVLAACLAALVSLYCEETIPAATERATTEATAAATETTQPPVQTDLPTDTATSTTTPAPSDGTGTPGTIPTTAPPTSRPATPGGGTPVLAPPTVAPAPSTTVAPGPSATGQPGPTSTPGPTSVVPVATPTSPSQTPGPTPTLVAGSPTRTQAPFPTATSAPTSEPRPRPTPTATTPAAGPGPGPAATPTNTPMPPPTATPIPNRVEVLLIPETSEPTSEAAPAVLPLGNTMDFTVHVVTHGVKVSAITVSMIYAPAVLEVVDALAPAGLQIEPHPESPLSQFVVDNEVDNSDGTIRFTSGSITPATEDFDLVVVTFRAKAATGDGSLARVWFLVSGGDETQAANAGAPLLAKTANYVGAYILIQ